MAEADPQIQPDAETDSAKKPRPRLRRMALMLSVPAILLALGVGYWLSLQGKISTDNAYVRQDKVSVSAEVNGKIVDVAVAENQLVEAGDLLFRIDPEPYRIDLAEADAAIATAQADVTARAGNASLTGADIAAAQEDIAFAQATLRRQQALWERGFTTKAALEEAEHAVEQGREALRVAQAEQAEARARLARDVHPLLATRGVPGTHDLDLADAVFSALASPVPPPVPRSPPPPPAQRPRLPRVRRCPPAPAVTPSAC